MIEIGNHNSSSVKALVLCLADPTGNPRPKRAIELCLKMGMDVSVLSLPPGKEVQGVHYFALRNLSRSISQKVMRKIYGLIVSFSLNRFFRDYVESLRLGFESAWKELPEGGFDIMVVEDLFLLPLAFSKKGKAKVVFDAREYYPRQNEGNLWFEMVEKRRRIELCRRFLPLCDAVLTVSDGLAKEYRKEFGVEATVVRSTPHYAEIEATHCSSDKIRMVYHGAASKNRKLENLIRIFELLGESFTLDLILVSDEGYQEKLKKRAANNPRIGFPKPVPFKDIIPTLNKYDIGFFYYEPTGFNIANCLPNKFFEYIQARIMVAIGPTPDMAKLVSQYQCGVVSEEFSVESMAKVLNSLTPEKINKMKNHSDSAAKILCFEKEQKKFEVLLNTLLPSDLPRN